MTSIRATDGHELSYRVWPAASGARAGTFVLLNGVMSHAGWFDPLATRIAAAGYHVVGADRRGSGGNSVARGDTPNAGQLVADVKSIINAEREVTKPLVLVGWCWGGVLAVNVALELQAELAGLVLLAPGLYPTAKLKADMAAEAAKKSGAREDDPCLESPIVEEMFTTGPALQNFILRDELRLKRFTPRFHQANVKLAMNAVMRLKTLKTPMLVVLASDDLATDNADTLKALEKLPPGQVEVKTLESMHGMQFDQPEQLARELTRWFADRNARG